MRRGAAPEGTACGGGGWGQACGGGGASSGRGWGRRGEAAEGRGGEGGVAAISGEGTGRGRRGEAAGDGGGEARGEWAREGGMRLVGLGPARPAV